MKRNSWQREVESSRWQVRCTEKIFSPRISLSVLGTRQSEYRRLSGESEKNSRDDATKAIHCWSLFHWVWIYFIPSCCYYVTTRHYLRAQSQGQHTIDHLEERGAERGRARRSSFERTREGHRQSDEHWNRFKGNAGETSERRGGARMGFSERIDTILNWTEQSSPQNTFTCKLQRVFYIFISSNFLTTLQRHWYKCASHFPNI